MRYVMEPVSSDNDSGQATERVSREEVSREELLDDYEVIGDDALQRLHV